MKKNVMMRVASVMLVMVLMTSSVISGTFAKYVTSDSASASARVAKWGVEFVTNSDDLFKPQYNYKAVPTGVSAEYSVKANTDVVAPGTSGTGYNFTTNHPMGNPEVSYVVTFDVKDGAKTVSLTKGVDTYYPIQYKLILGATTVIDSSNNLTGVIDALENCQYMYDVDKNQYYISTDNGANWIAYAGIPSLDLSWSWAFEQSKDIEDTVLGNHAAGYALSQLEGGVYTAANLEVAFDITATATQID